MGCGGAGVAKNAERALEYYRRAATLGDTSAMFNLGLEYRDGQIVRRSIRHAERWFARAAQNGHARARRYLRRLRGTRA